MQSLPPVNCVRHLENWPIWWLTGAWRRSRRKVAQPVSNRRNSLNFNVLCYTGCPATRAAGSNGIWRLESCQIELRALLNEPEPPLSCAPETST